MNRISFPRISYDGTQLTQDALERWYTSATNIESEISQRLNSVSASTFVEKRTLQWIKKCLHSILLASPERLQRMVKITDKFGAGLFRKKVGSKTVFTPFGEAIFYAFRYDSYRRNKLVLLAAKLNVKTCPYCNMHYTLYAEDGNALKDQIAKLQFDHFFDKTDYPFLSMSLYNLIPSCATCNQGKSVGNVSLKFHPYASSIADQFHFEVADPLILFTGGKKDRLEIEMIEDGVTKEELKDFNETFNLQLLYRRHRDIVQETFDKAYEEEYYTNPKNFSFASEVSTEYITRLGAGTYMEKSDIEKRPMAKFIQDIWKQAQVYKLNGITIKHK